MSLRIPLSALLVTLMLVLGSCTAAPPVSPSVEPEESEAAATDRPEPTEAAEPAESSDPAAEEYFVSMCELQQDFSDELQALSERLDEADELEFDERLEEYQRQGPLRRDLYGSTIEALEELTPPEGAEEFHATLIETAQTTLEAQVERGAAFEDAQTNEDIDAADSQFEERSQVPTRERLMAVATLPADQLEILADQELCRSMNLEAAAGAPTDESPFEWPTAYETDFEGEQVWNTFEADAEAGEPSVGYDEGTYRWEFEGPGGFGVDTHPDMYDDVRVQTDVSFQDEARRAEGGVICRGDYTVRANERGTVRLYARDVVVAQRTTDNVDAGVYTVALECYGGEEEGAVTLVAEVNGERVIEYVDEGEDAGITLSGPAGMVAGTNGPAVVIFDNFSVSTPEE